MPKLQDKTYGEMKWDDEEFCWFSLVEVVPGDQIKVCVYAETSSVFLAVRNTHQTYNRLRFILMRKFSRKTNWFRF